MGSPMDPTLEGAVDLNELLGRGSFLYTITASLLRNALLHPDLDLREEAIQALQKRYEGLVRKGVSPPAADCTWSSATGRTLHACSTSASGRRPTWACAARRSRSTSRRALASIDIYDLCRSQDGNRTSHSSCACQTPSHRNRVDTMLSTDVTYRIDENKGG